MKKVFSALVVMLFVFCCGSASAQSFNMQADTVWFSVPTTSALYTFPDTVAPATGAVTLTWSLVATNFPPDWMAASGFCDNVLCVDMNTLAAGGSHTSTPYPVTGTDHSFIMQLQGNAITSTSCYYARAKLVNQAVPDSAYATYVICRSSVGVEDVNSNSKELVLYPNPATSEINLVYSGSTAIKTATVYDVVGKLMQVYVMKGNSINLTLSNMHVGIYFIKLADAAGRVVSTQRFTKQ